MQQLERIFQIGKNVKAVLSLFEIWDISRATVRILALLASANNPCHAHFVCFYWCP